MVEIHVTLPSNKNVSTVIFMLDNAVLIISLYTKFVRFLQARSQCKKR